MKYNHLIEIRHINNIKILRTRILNSDQMKKLRRKIMEIFVVSHCLLNSLTRVKGIRQPEPFQTKDQKIIQLPCPELIFAGADRDRKTKEDYDTTEYRDLCRDLFNPYAILIEALAKDGHEIHFIGVPKSPSCGVLTTTKQMQINAHETENEVVEGKGVFFEEIEKELNRRDVKFLFSE